MVKRQIPWPNTTQLHYIILLAQFSLAQFSSVWPNFIIFIGPGAAAPRWIIIYWIICASIWLALFCLLYFVLNCHGKIENKIPNRRKETEILTEPNFYAKNLKFEDLHTYPLRTRFRCRYWHQFWGEELVVHF